MLLCLSGYIDITMLLWWALAIRNTCWRSISVFCPVGTSVSVCIKKKVFLGVGSSSVRMNIWKLLCRDSLHSKQLSKVVSGLVILISKKPWNTGEVFREFECKIMIIITKAILGS